MKIPIIFLLYLQTLTLITSTINNISINISNHLFLNLDSQINDHRESSHQRFPYFLKDVLKKITDKQKWKLEDILAAKFDSGSARIGRFMRYDVRLRVGRSDLYFGVSDDVVSWKKLKNFEGDDFELLKDEVGSVPLIDSLKLEGPFELLVDGNDAPLLHLPMNRTFRGLKRVVVGEGITVEVKGARKVSIFCSSDLDLPVNRSSGLTKTTTEIWPLGHASCAPLLPVHIFGSSSLVAYKTQNPDGYMETSFLTNDIIELLPEKCYNRHVNRKLACPIAKLRPRIASTGKLLRRLLGGRYRQTGLLGSVKVKVRALAAVRFRLELERRIERRLRVQGMLAEWRTRPIIERNSFEILARVEEETLKPFSVKKMIPFDVEDSIALSSLMFNISFTKFPSLLVRSEALTLDVKCSGLWCIFLVLEDLWQQQTPGFKKIQIYLQLGQVSEAENAMNVWAEEKLSGLIKVFLPFASGDD